MTAIPTPRELCARYPQATSPEAIARALGYAIVRHDAPPTLPGVRVASEFSPPATIILYPAARESARDEAWHIAHEVYHALAETAGHSAWIIPESEADAWASALLACLTFRRRANGE